MSVSPRAHRLKFANTSNEKAYRDHIEHFKRAKTLKAEDPDHYEATRLLRDSYVEVHERAIEQRERASPRNFSNVKSKVKGNMNSQKKAKKMKRQVDDRKAYDMNMVGRLLSSSPTRVDNTYIGFRNRSPAKSPVKQTATAGRESPSKMNLGQSLADESTQQDTLIQ